MADPIDTEYHLDNVLSTLKLKPSERTHLQITRLASFLRSQEGFLQPISQNNCELICKWLEYEYAEPGASVYREGDFGDSMFIILEGSCEVQTPASCRNNHDSLDIRMLHQGLAFGELALIKLHKPRSCTVAAGKHGAHLATLDRSALQHMRFLAEAQPAQAGTAVQSVLAACCTNVLRVAPGRRTAAELELLAEFMGQLEAFKRLPADMVGRLAADCSYMRLPAGWVLFEEDAPGNCMYVAVSGHCEVRARPLAQRQAELRKRGVAGGVMGRGAWTDANSTVAGKSVGSSNFGDPPASSQSPGAAAGNRIHLQTPVMSVSQRGSRDWDRDGARPKSQTRLERFESSVPLRTNNAGVGCLDATGMEASRGSSGAGSKGISTGLGAVSQTKLTTQQAADDSATYGQMNGPSQANAEAAAPSAGGVVRDSPFWIARYMVDAMKQLSISDTQAGIGQNMTPLAAVAAAKWRARAAGRGSSGAGEPTEEDRAEFHGQGNAMDTLLGRAAAKALRVAVDNGRNRQLQHGEQYTPYGSHRGTSDGTRSWHGTASATSRASEREQHGGAAEENQRAQSAQSQAVSDSSYRTRQQRQLHFESPAAPVADSDRCIAAPQVQRPSPLVTTPTLEHEVSTISYSASLDRRVPSALPADGPAQALEDPAKRLLSVIGSRDPANVSRALVSELVQRADINVVLYEFAKRLVRRGGGPQKITRVTSRRINEALQHRIRAGVDCLPDTVQGKRVLGRHELAAPYSGILGPESSTVSGPSDQDGRFCGHTPRKSPSFGRPGSARTLGGLTSWRSYIEDDDEEGNGDEGTAGAFSTMSQYNGASSTSQGVMRSRAAEELAEQSNILKAEYLTPEQLDQSYGPVIRTISPGQSFGELALLHRDSRRTATVMAARPSSPPGSTGARHALSTDAVDLICIMRSTYNHTVRATQMAQLQGLLGFLGRLPPFRGLSEQQRASLAVFCRQREVPSGAVLAVQGEPVDALWMVQDGEVLLLDSSGTVAEPLLPTGPRGLVRNLSQPTTRGPAQMATGGLGRNLLRQISAPDQGVARSGSSQDHSNAHRRVMFDASAANHTRGGNEQDAGRFLPPGVLWGSTLTSMGPGGVFGEAVLSSRLAPLKSDKQPAPQEAVKNALPRGAAAPIFPCTFVARRATRLLTISANDISRFADMVAGPLAELAASRGALLAARAASVSSAKAVVSQRVEGARNLLGEIRGTMAMGVPVEGNPRLAAAVRQEELAAAAAKAAETPEAIEAAAAARAQSQQLGKQEVMRQRVERETQRALRMPSVKARNHGGVAALASDLGSSMAAALAQLDRSSAVGPLSSLSKVSSQIHRATVMASLSNPRPAAAPHPLAAKLSAVLDKDMPCLPPPLLRSGQVAPDDPEAILQDARFGGDMRLGSGPIDRLAHSLPLSTIQEESSSAVPAANALMAGEADDAADFTMPAIDAADAMVMPTERTEDDKAEAFSHDGSSKLSSSVPSPPMQPRVQGTAGEIHRMEDQLRSLQQLLKSAFDVVGNADVDRSSEASRAANISDSDHGRPSLQSHIHDVPIGAAPMGTVQHQQLPPLVHPSAAQPATGTIAPALPGASTRISAVDGRAGYDGELSRSGRRTLSGYAEAIPGSGATLPPLPGVLMPGPHSTISPRLPVPSSDSLPSQEPSQSEDDASLPHGVALSARASRSASASQLDSVRRATRLSSAGSNAGSISIYTDDGTTSPDLSSIRYEVAAARRVALLPSLVPRPGAATRRSLSLVSEGLAPIPSVGSFTSAASGAGGLGRVSSSGAAALAALAADAVLVEGQGAVVERLVGGRPLPRSRSDSGRHRTSLSGKLPSMAPASGVPSLDGRPPTAPRAEGSGASLSGASATQVGNPDVHGVEEQGWGASKEAAAAEAAGGSVHAIADYGIWPPLPWGQTRQEYLPVGHPRASARQASQQVVDAAASDADQQDSASEEARGLWPQAPEHHDLTRPDLPSLRTRAAALVDALADGPQACSPRAALTDSPLRRQAGPFDSPVHSPRVVTHVY